MKGYVMPFDIDAQIEGWKRSLLDTTKRNRLGKVSTGRGGGIAFCAPATDTLWRRMVVDNRVFLFPWKRAILELPAAAIDGDEDTRANPIGATDDVAKSAQNSPARTTTPSLFPNED